MSKKKNGCSGCFSFIMFLFIVIIACVIIVSIPDSDNVTNDSDNTDTSAVTDNVGATDTPALEEVIGDDEYLYYYRQLDSAGKEIYEKLLSAVRAGNDSCTFNEIDYAVYGPSVDDAISALTYDHPLHFWLTNGYKTEYLDRDGTKNDYMKFHFDYYSYWNFTMSPDKYINELNAEVDKVCTLAKQYTSPVDQAIFVHDYLIKNAEYDHDTLAEARKTIHAASSEYIYSAYGCLVNKKCVCSGYAEAFQLIMNKLGVNTTVVIGDAGGPHEWNMIELEGENYYIDVTWDDHDRKNDSGVFIYTNDSDYEYMCITTEELRKTHTPDALMFSPPNCLSTRYNYFVYNGYFLWEYSFSEFNRIVTEQATEKKIITVKLANRIEFNEAIEDIITNKNGFNIPALSKGYKYVTDDNHFTIKFILE